MNGHVECNCNRRDEMCTCREDECPFYSLSYCEARDCCECEYNEDDR